METKFERHLIEHCAPTLAGIKVGNLFSFTLTQKDDVHRITNNYNQCFSGKGIEMRLIKETETDGLIYIFRPEQLIKLLMRKDVSQFLNNYGFSSCKTLDSYISTLMRHLKSETQFPHEIGIFLGYPLHDVQGFIQNHGKKFKFCGFWKVYSEMQYAEKLFAQYRKCFDIYKTMFKGGHSILQLTVAS